MQYGSEVDDLKNLGSEIDVAIKKSNFRMEVKMLPLGLVNSLNEFAEKLKAGKVNQWNCGETTSPIRNSIKKILTNEAILSSELGRLILKAENAVEQVTEQVMKSTVASTPVKSVGTKPEPSYDIQPKVKLPKEAPRGRASNTGMFAPRSPSQDSKAPQAQENQQNKLQSDERQSPKPGGTDNK